jgi:hypothetical protein
MRLVNNNRIYNKIRKNIIEGKTVYLDVDHRGFSSRLRVLSLFEATYGNYHYGGDMNKSCFSAGVSFGDVESLINNMKKYDNRFGYKIINMRAE